MTDRARIAFAKPAAKPGGTVVAFAGPDVALGPLARALGVAALVGRAAETADFKGKAMTTLDLIAPGDTGLDRLVVIGTGKLADLKEKRLAPPRRRGDGRARQGEAATVLLERPDGRKPTPGGGRLRPRHAAPRLHLRQIQDDQGRERRAERQPADITIAVADPAAGERAWAARSAVADGVLLARDLVNEPPTCSVRSSSRARAEELKTLGVEVEILDEKEMKKLGMARASRRGAGLAAAAAPRRHALERRQGEGPAGRLRRQGRRLRHRRHLDQAGRAAWRT